MTISTTSLSFASLVLSLALAGGVGTLTGGLDVGVVASASGHIAGA